MIWNHEDLWNKSAVYIRRAFEYSRESFEFPFWASLGLELLGRSTLAFVHPSLLADPAQGENILYACGFPSTKTPKSVPVKTVFHRLVTIVPDFNEEEYKYCLLIMERRNSELHSGDLAFENFPVGVWYPDFVRICDILVTFQRKSLDNLIGEEEANIARQVIASINEKKQDEVFKLIKEFKENFLSLPKEEQEAKKKLGIEWVKKSYPNSKCIDCPSCGSRSRLIGDVVRYLQPTIDEDYIIERSIVLPKTLLCRTCELILKGHSLLFAAGFGDQFTLEEEYEPKEYLGDEYDPEDFYEPDYGND